MKDTDDWVVRLSASAWHLLKELEALCEHSGLDCYIQAQIKLCAASDPKDIALWSEDRVPTHGVRAATFGEVRD